MSTQKTKYSQVPSSVRASFWFAACSVLQKGIQFITIPLFTRLLTTEQYGQFSLYQSWLNLLTIFATLNLAGGVFNNGMIRYEEDRDTFTSAMQGLSGTAVLLTFCVYLAAADWWDRLIGMPRILVAAIFAEMFFCPALQYWSLRQRFEYRYRALTAITLAVAVCNPVLGFIAISLTPERGIARALSVALLNTAAGLVFYLYNLLRGKKLFVRSYWKFALAFNIPLIPHYLSQMVLSQSDRIMIEKMFGKSPVAVYSIAYSIGMVMNIITSSINASFIPWTYQMCKAGNYRRIGKVASLFLALSAGIVLVPILMAPEVIAVMGPQEYADAIWVIPPVAVAGYVTFVYSLFANIEFYFAESKFVMVASSMAAIANIIMNWFGMRWFGYIAAGYTTVICYAILAAAHYCFMRKVLRKHAAGAHVYDVRVICGITLALCVAAALCMLLYPYALLRYGLLLASAAVMWLQRGKLFELMKDIKK